MEAEINKAYRVTNCTGYPQGKLGFDDMSNCARKAHVLTVQLYISHNIFFCNSRSGSQGVSSRYHQSR